MNIINILNITIQKSITKWYLDPDPDRNLTESKNWLKLIDLKEFKSVLREPLATIEQYRISFNRNTMVVNDHFIREGHLWQLSTEPGQVVTPHSISWKGISKLNWTNILVYSSALQCNKVQSSIEKFH